MGSMGLCFHQQDFQDITMLDNRLSSHLLALEFGLSRQLMQLHLVQSRTLSLERSGTWQPVKEQAFQTPHSVGNHLNEHIKHPEWW